MSTEIVERRASVRNAAPSPPREAHRQDATHDLVKLRDGVVDCSNDLRELATEMAEVRRHMVFHSSKGECQRDEPLLRSVVQVALDAAAILFRCGHPHGIITSRPATTDFPT